jgi:hypothetical protein
MRRFDFDPETVVRMCWQGQKPVSTMKYFRKEAASHTSISSRQFAADLDAPSV